MLFPPSGDLTPALYLGFDQPLPADLVVLYLDVEEVAGEDHGQPLRWEHWDGGGWQPLTVQDETRDLALPGMVSVLWPGLDRAPAGDHDSGARGPFGKPGAWLRARLETDADPRRSRINGMYVNAVWALQMETIDDELLGSGHAQPNAVLFFRHLPVLEGEVIEVRELDGLRAAVELPMLLEDLQRHGLSGDRARVVTDARTGHADQVWVRWERRPNLSFSGPTDRHYVIEASRGRLLFGDDRHGRVPPAGPDSVRARRYRSGGGQAGNVAPGVITQLLSGTTAQGATNPRGGEGGADGQALDDVLLTGPQWLRNRAQAISLDDFEALARQASPAVAVARALPAIHPSGRPAPGWVKVVIVPHSLDSRPQPSFQLRRQVRQFLAGRVPAGVTDRISVAGPEYVAVGVRAVVAPLDLSDAGVISDRVVTALGHFLHPLIGGPRGRGWTFGRDVHLSDVAGLVERVEGVDYVETIDLLLDGTPRGESIPVPHDRIVTAGRLEISLTGSED